jgi:hypothetical protein
MKKYPWKMSGCPPFQALRTAWRRNTVRWALAEWYDCGCPICQRECYEWAVLVCRLAVKQGRV